MPYLRPSGGTFVPCQDYARGAFLVSDLTAAQWEALVRIHGPRPTNVQGWRIRPYPALDVPSHAPYAPDGVYTDHRDPAVEQAAYELRDRLNQLGEPRDQSTLRPLVVRFGLRHWRDAYNTVRNVGRRVHGRESGRDNNGELRWRRWNTGGYTPQALAATAPGTGTDRAFGIEVEFVGDYDAPGRIATAARQAGLTFVDRWHRYGRDMSTAGWQGTHDATVSGEIISDIMPGDQASLDEVSTMLAVVRDNGGSADRRQGMHVHHDARDFALADRIRLVDNVEACQDALLAFVHPFRVSGPWSRAMGPSDFAHERASIARGGSGCGSHGYAWNFGHLTASSARLEVRALGWTLNGTIVRTWVRVFQAFMRATKAGVTFAPATSVDDLLATLRQHGLSTWAAGKFAEQVARRGRMPVTV